MGTVRPFRESDIPGAADLHRRVFGVAPAGSPELERAYRRYFSQVFLDDRWKCEGLSPLVHQEVNGAITGFLGVVSRPMTMDRRRVVGAVSSQFVVAPESRSRMVGVELLKAFLAGPQDVSLADEAWPAAGKLWEAMGGVTSLLYSTHWTRPLRPAGLALAVLRCSASRSVLAASAATIARTVDALVARYPRNRLRPSPPPGLEVQTRNRAAFFAHLPELLGECSLRPDHDEHHLRWLLTRASAAAGEDRLHEILLRDEGGRPVGAYVYTVDASRVGYVLQIAATVETIDRVLEHLLHHAWERGLVSLEGRIEPRFMRALARHHAIFHQRGALTLVRAKRPEILSAFDSGRAFFSRLDGEHCLRFYPGLADA
jgi:hypothetical protein